MRSSSSARPSRWPEVVAVAGRVLTDQHDLAHALLEELADLAQHQLGVGLLR